MTSVTSTTTTSSVRPLKVSRKGRFSGLAKTIQEMSPEDIAELRDAFTTFDKDGNGTICFNELEYLMRNLGLKPTELELQELMHDADMNGNGTVDFLEFIAIMLTYAKRTDSEEEIIEAFKIFDRDKDGFVTATDLQVIIKNMTTQLNESDYEDMVHEFDADGDNKLDFEEFYAMMTT